MPGIILKASEGQKIKNKKKTKERSETTDKEDPLKNQRHTKQGS